MLSSGLGRASLEFIALDWGRAASVKRKTGPARPNCELSPTRERVQGESLVLIGSEVGTGALRAGFPVDVGVDVGFQVAYNGGR